MAVQYLERRDNQDAVIFLDPLSLKLDFHMYMRDEQASRSSGIFLLFCAITALHRITEVC